MGTKYKAVKYLIKHNVYSDEWTGAGMYEAIVKLYNYKGIITRAYLDNLLKEASEF